MGVDDADPSCPECGEPVGTNASYCMHCGAEFDVAEGVGTDDGGLVDSLTDATDDAPDVESTPATVEDEEGGSVGTDASSVGSPDSTPATGTTENPGGSSVGDVASVGGADATGEETSLMHPDGTLDNSLTVVVGIAAGVAVGFLSLVVFVPTLGLWGGLVGLAVWAVGTAYLSRRRTVFDAVEQGAYGLALLVLSLSVVFALEDGGGFAARLETFVTALLPLALFAAVVAAVGYAFGLKGVE